MTSRVTRDEGGEAEVHDIQGHPMVYVGTETGDGWVRDEWEDIGQDEDDVFRLGFIVTMTEQRWTSWATPDGWGEEYERAVADEPLSTPLERFHEALRQGRERALERLGAPLNPVQVWPPADALTLVAVAVAGDTRKGFTRWTWLADGSPVVVQSDPEQMLAGRVLPDFSDPEATRAWATTQGWASVSFSGPWPGA